MSASNDRIDGWKSIAAYLGRDRSTVIRWTSERGLPVHSVPGGKRRTVYAVRGELDAWVRAGEGATKELSPDQTRSPQHDGRTEQPLPRYAENIEEPPPAPAPASAESQTPSAPDRSVRRLIRTAAVLVLVASVVVSVLILRTRVSTSGLDATTRARLLQASDQVASRSASDLDAAIATLLTVVRRHPDNPDVQAALAEAYLLAREFGSLPDAFALAASRQSATKALEMDPASAKALRVLGVIAYWADHDPTVAGTLFRQAIAAQPTDALSHQWYANILADNGEDRAAMREFQRSRELNPGAPYLMADYAWALWVAGDNGTAKDILRKLAQTQPPIASIHDALSVIAFAGGDFRSYARHLRRRALARAVPELLTHSRLIDEALVDGPASRAFHDAVLGRALAQAEAGSPSDHSWAAFVASVFKDRAELISILRRARLRREQWGAAGYTRRIAAVWARDAQIMSDLKQLQQARIEPDG